MKITHKEREWRAVSDMGPCEDLSKCLLGLDEKTPYKGNEGQRTASGIISPPEGHGLFRPRPYMSLTSVNLLRALSSELGPSGFP